MLLALMLALQMSQTAGAEVVVTGERLKRLHEQCRAGRCTPLRDAQASIAWAEAQFRDGRYLDAKRTLRDAAARNARHAAAHPKPVAAIWEAYATVSWQEGDQTTHRRAVAHRVRTLRDHLPPDDVAVRGAALAMGDMWQRLGLFYDAARTYAGVESAAVAAGHADVALRARLARVRVEHQLGRKASAARLLASAAALAPGDRWAGSVVRAMRVRLAAMDGNRAELDRLAAELGGAGFSRPVLLDQPPLPRELDDGVLDGRLLVSAADPNSVPVTFGPATTPDPAELRWADLGFWIRPDGRTGEVEVLGGSPDRRWTAEIVAQVSARRYSATPNAPAGDPGFYRLERYTLRPQYRRMTPTGYLVSVKAGPERLEMIDLTDPNAKVTAAR